MTQIFQTKEVDELVEHCSRFVDERLNQVVTEYSADERTHLNDEELGRVRHYFTEYALLLADVGVRIRQLSAKIVRAGFGIEEQCAVSAKGIWGDYIGEMTSGGSLEERFNQIADEHFEHIERQRNREATAFLNDQLVIAGGDISGASEALKEAGLDWPHGENPLYALRSQVSELIEAHFVSE